MYEACRNRINISYIWIFGHSGIEDNEIADQEPFKTNSSTDTSTKNLSTYENI